MRPPSARQWRLINPTALSQDTRTTILSRLSSAPVLALVLFLTNAWICRGLFTIEYTRYLDSIEGAYIGLARWMVAHPFDWSWFPTWYNGIPFQDAYPPLLHFIVTAVATLTGASPAHSYHLVTAVFYCLGPVTLFWRSEERRVGKECRSRWSPDR